MIPSIKEFVIKPRFKIKYQYGLKYDVNTFNGMSIEKENQEQEEEFGPNGDESVEGEDG